MEDLQQINSHSPVAMISSTTWSPDLPPSVLCTILRRLPSHADRVRFAAACRPWRAAATRQPSEPLPWVALPDGTFFSFPNSSNTFNFPDAIRYRGSCDDWLIFHNHDDQNGEGYRLLNPFSGATMRLPSLTSIRHVSQDPVDGTTLTPVDIKEDGRAPANTTVQKLIICPDQVIVAIIGDQTRAKIVACRGDGAEFWTIRAHEQWREFRDMAFHDGKVFVIDDNSGHYVFGVSEDPNTGVPVTSLRKRVVNMLANRSCVPVSRHLVVAGGRLLMVTREVGSGGGQSTFKVFEIDRSATLWVEVRNIRDDTVLFIGRWSSVARSVAKYEMPGNMIYFLDDDRISDTTFGAYNIRDGKTTNLRSSSSPALHSDGGTPATWLFSRDHGPSLTLSDLPSDILGQVLRLVPRDMHLSLRQVCRVLHAAVHQHCPPQRRPPAPAYLVHPDGTIFRYDATLTYLCFHDAANYGGVACDGWLLFNDDLHQLQLRSPLTGKTRMLPGLLNVRVSHDPVDLDPELGRGKKSTDDNGEMMAVQKMALLPDGVIAALLSRDSFSKIALCSPETTTFAWMMSAHDGWRKYEDMTVCGGRLYALTNTDDLIAFDVVTGTDDHGPRISRIELAIMGGYAPRQYGPDVPMARYLVTSKNSNKMFMVRRPLRIGERETLRLAVFRADLASQQWVEVSTLTEDGDDDSNEGMALFVGRLCSRAVPASGNGRNAVQRDQILFLHDDSVRAGCSRYCYHRVAVYDMRDGTITDVPELNLWREAPAPATWLFPEANAEQ